MAVVVVQGAFVFANEGERDAFVRGRREMMRSSRAEQGCVEYTFAADPLDATRVVLTERWESQADLDAHLAALRRAPATTDEAPQPTSRTITIFDATATATL